MIISFKLVMAPLAIILSVLVVAISAIDFQEVTKTNGVKQFVISQESDILLPNLKQVDKLNSKLGHVTLNLTLKGVTVDEVSVKEADKIWNLKFSDEAIGTISTSVTEEVSEYYFIWPWNKNALDEREVCIHMGKDTLWYNTFQQKTQRWPMDLKTEIKSYPLNSVPLDFDSEIEFIVEHLFVSSNGFAIMLDKVTPLWFRIDPNNGDPLMCVTSKRDSPYDNKETKDDYTNIKLSIFAGADVKTVYDVVANKLKNIPKPDVIPNDLMFAHPIWSIIPGKGKFFATKADISQAKVIEFTQELKKHGYLHSMISLGTDWQQDSAQFLTFNTNFLNPEHMMTAIHTADYKLDLLVDPYVLASSDDYADHKDWFVKDKSGSALLIKSGPYSGKYIVDFSNQHAYNWFHDKLQKLQTDFKVDSFVFNSIAFFDRNFTLASAKMQKISVLFGEEYARLAAKFGQFSTVRDGHRTQDLSIFTRMMDRTTDWGYQKGLKSLIPTALAMSIGGYSFIVPDIIGGRTGDTPSEELYIRWVQATTFMPTMQFAIPPWDYSSKTATLVRKFVKLHEEYAPLFVDLARKRVLDGTPIVRPVWYVDAGNVNTYTIDNQFMVGEDLLVAPVVEQGQTRRSVYFPRGTWIDHAGKKKYNGPGEEDVDAPIEELLFFKRTMA